MSREIVICFVALLLTAAGLLAHASGIFEQGEIDWTRQVEWLSAEDGAMPEAPRAEIIASGPATLADCLKRLKAFTREYPEIAAVWEKTPNTRTAVFRGAGDDGATIRVTCAIKLGTITVSQHW